MRKHTLFLEPGFLALVFGALFRYSTSFGFSAPQSTFPPSKSFWSTNRWTVMCHQFLSCHTAASLCQQMAQMPLWQKAMRGKMRSECKGKTGKESRRKNLTLVSSWQHGRHTCNSFYVLHGRLLDIKTNGSLISPTQIFSSILVLSLLLLRGLWQCNTGWPFMWNCISHYIQYIFSSIIVGVTIVFVTITIVWQKSSIHDLERRWGWVEQFLFQIV